MFIVLVACLSPHLRRDHTKVLLAILLIFDLISASFADLIDGTVEKTTLI